MPGPGSSGPGPATGGTSVDATPGGSDTQVQFNDGGAFGGDSGLVFNKTSNVLTVGGGVNSTGGYTSTNGSIGIAPGTGDFSRYDASSNRTFIMGSNTTGSAQWTSGMWLGWTSSTADAFGTPDTTISRSAAGTVQIGTTAANASGHLKAASVRGTAVAFASLPATPVEGMLVGVTDSNTATWGATIAGSGANHVLAYYNGTVWKVACA